MSRHLPSRHPDSPLTGPTMFAIPSPCWLHKSCSANLARVILKIFKYFSLKKIFVFMINLWFTGYSKWYFNKSRKTVIKLRFCWSKTFWPRCRLIWTASWRFCMNSFGQRWQRNSWKIHKSIVYYSIISIQRAQFFIHCTSVQYWDLNLYSSMLSLMILPRTV